MKALKMCRRERIALWQEAASLFLALVVGVASFCATICLGLFLTWLNGD